jgi:D-alanyl-D-alanine carboxypeptidase (penicillin-binding protein 5/6)
MLRPTRLRATGLALAVALAVPLSGLPVGPASADDTAVLGGDQLAGYGVRVNLGADAASLPAVAAKSWVLADLTTGEILASKGAHRQGRPASTMKTLTALTLMPVLDRDAEHTVTWKEASADGGRVGIVPDATYTNWDLWHGLLLPSGNDAAAALAGSHGGMKKTVADMQAVAASIQANDTVVRNASGLDADGQLTSAYDLALIARAAMQLEDFRTVTSSISYDFPGRPAGKGKKRPTYKIYTQNRLLLHGFDGAVGGKTGYTTLAGRTFWGAAERDGHVLAVTLLQVRERTETAAKDLLTWGFANRTKVTPVGALVDPLPVGGEVTPPTESAAPQPESTSAAGAPSGSTTAASTGIPPLAAALGAAVVLGGLLLWWLRGRRRRPELTSSGMPDLTPNAVPTTSPAPPSLVLPEPEQTVVLPEPDPAPAAVAPEVPPAPKPAPTTGGNVKVVRPPKP